MLITEDRYALTSLLPMMLSFSAMKSFSYATGSRLKDSKIKNKFFTKEYDILKTELFNVVAYANNVSDAFTKNVLKTLLAKILQANNQTKKALEILEEQVSYFAKENNLLTDFVEPVIYKEGSEYEERVSSSFIRQMIQKGFFSTVNELLERPYEIDLSVQKITQVLPPDGVYHCKDENENDVRVEIKNGKIFIKPDVKISCIKF